MADSALTMGGGGRIAAAAIIAALPGLAVRRAAAQQEPMVINPQQQLQPFVLGELDAGLEINWRHDVDDREQEGGVDTREVEDRFREFFDLGAKAYIGHPNLIDLDLGGRFGLTQRELDLEPGTSERTSETLWEYDASALILQKRRLPLLVYSRRTQNDVSQAFGGTLESTITEHGARLSLRSDVIPTSVQYLHREQQERDRLGSGDFDLTQDTVIAEGRVEPGGGHRLWWDYTWDDIDERGDLRQTLSFQRQEANIYHTLDFGPEEQHQMRSAVRYFDESGDLDYQQLRINERLRLRHAPWLTSWYEYIEDRVEQNQLEQEAREVRATVRHQLYESVSTTAHAGARWLEIPTDDFSSDSIFGGVDCEYTKRVPLGRLFVGGQLDLDQVDQTDRGVAVPIVDQNEAFGAAGLIIIQQDNVLPGSIRITDATGTIVYSEGFDYTVDVLPDRVEIRRVLGGDIAEGQPLRIDYEIGPEPGGEITTVGWGVNLRYTFDEGVLRGLSPYFRYFEQDEDRSPAVTADGVFVNDFTETTWGVDYTIWRISLTAEQRVRDSSISPLEITRFEGRYFHSLGPGSTLILSAQHQELDRTDESFRTRSTTFSGRWNRVHNRRLRTDLTVQYRMEDDSDGRRVDAFEQELDVLWEYRQTTFYATLRNSLLDSDTQDRTLQTILVGVRREF